MEPSVIFCSIHGTPVVGDFNGDGLSDIAVVGPGQAELIWKFDYDQDGTLDKQHAFGFEGDKLLVGTWRFPAVRVRLPTGVEIFPTSVVGFGITQSDEHPSLRFRVSNPGDRFGTSVGVYFDTVVVGASQQTGPGFACVFQKSPENTNRWQQVKRLEKPEIGSRSRFGSSVSRSNENAGGP